MQPKVGSRAILLRALVEKAHSPLLLVQTSYCAENLNAKYIDKRWA